ncbi:MAG: PBP1A family penicillin-binding protein [Candidatus Kerfeldbacteria bacterium]|nr:PBP1A family penicillin-binding protein [Candidatus Kerfeldbacteria bacterium]
MPIPHLKRPPPNAEDPTRRFDRTWRAAKPRGGPTIFRALVALGGLFMVAGRRAWERMRAAARQQARRERLVRFWFPLGATLALFFVFSTVVVFAWFSRDLPDPDKISDRNVAQSTRIYARDGKTLLYEIHGDERRTVVELSEITPSVINATVAIEDKDFYKHQGFSLTGIVRALWRDVTTGSSQGGSTITQQFVKNAILTSEKRLTRKIREVVLAYQIERRFTKEQILKLYFNEIPYGSNAYGVEAAAETYFGKPARSLTLAESAVLAALPQAPTFYSPYGNHTDKLLGRAHYILDLMVEQGYLKQAEADAAQQDDVLKNVKPKRETIIAPHFVFYVKELLTEKYGEKVVERGGLRVTTTLDVDKQLAAEKVIGELAPANEKRWGATNVALVAIDPKTGQLLTMVGSRDYFNRDIDGNVNVALTLQQPGSSIKPIVYATAFSRGFTPETILFDLKTRFKNAGGPDYAPNNYDGKEHGPVAMRQALAGSLNIPAVKTLYLAGIDNVIDQAQKMGYTTWDDRSRLGLSLVLGGADVTLLEHTAAFGAFATEGMRYTTAPILRIEDRSGKILEEFKATASRVLDENVARMINSVLSDNDARSFIFGSRNRLTLPDRPVAAKTGTTQEYRDAWALGYTPSFVAGVWTGETRNKAMKPGADGSVVAAPIWNAFMRQALQGTRPESFKKPKSPKVDKPILQGKLEGEVPTKVDWVTGRQIPDSCLASWPKEFVTEKIVRAVHTILHYLNPRDPLGPAPADPTKDPQYASWEGPVHAWAKKNGYLEERPALESCELRTQAPLVTITSPAANATITTDSVAVSVSVSSPRTIAATEFYFNGVAVAQPTTTATTVAIPLVDVGNGFYPIRVVARDDVGNVGEASFDINVLHPT